MKELTIRQIEGATGGRTIAGDKKALVKRICKNSNEAEDGDLFVAIVGERHDAHKFIPECLERGCKSFLISDAKALAKIKAYDINIIVVEDTTEALQDLAAYYLDLLNIKKIAVTGSTGKTSTRDLIYYVCSQKYKCEKNKENLNNLIGVPMTILSFAEDTEVGIIEMGMDRFGEIHRLAEIVRPDIGVITNIGTAHIENLGSREGIFQAKMELVHDFRKEDILVVSTDEAFLTEERVKGNYRLITTGKSGDNNYVISHIDDFGMKGIQFMLEHEGNTQRIKLPVPGGHNAFNAALAVAVGTQLGISMEEAAQGLAKARLTGKRLAAKGKNGIEVIDDTYNASPASVKGAIDTLVHSQCLRTVAILGDMLELGEVSQQQHKLVGEYAAQQGVNLIIAIGSDARFIAEGAKSAMKGDLLYFETKEDFLKEVVGMLKKGDLVLVKGSRGMAMEQIVEKIIE